MTVEVGAARFGLEFGTAGLRAAMGDGPDQINTTTIRRASAGLAAWVNGRAGGHPASIVVGHDARHGSAQFARDAAGVFTAAGLRGRLISAPVPTPVLAFAVRSLGADAGVMVTASHNPATDNGYKVYAGDGAQIIPPADAEISARIDAAPGEPRLRDPERVDAGTLVDDYLDAIVPAALVHAGDARELRIVYTPVHGVGRDVMLAALDRAGFAAPHVVAAQSDPDPDFPTASRPQSRGAGGARSGPRRRAAPRRRPGARQRPGRRPARGRRSVGRVRRRGRMAAADRR